MAVLLLGGVGFSLACSSGDPARGAAERFIDAYYVEIDLPRARDAAIGLARAKVEEQLRLVTGQVALEAASRPTVYYRFVEQQQEPQHDRRGLLYELTLTLGTDQATRRALVTLRREGDAWRVANFQEID